MTKIPATGFVIQISFVIPSFGFRHFNWRFLNFVCVFCKFIAKHAREINVVQNDHIGVVFFVAALTRRLCKSQPNSAMMIGLPGAIFTRRG